MAFADALRRLEAPRSRPAPRVSTWLAPAWWSRGSRYRFTPGDGVELEVETVFDAPGIGAQRARWGGDAASFAEEIAPARTFGFVRDGARCGLAGGPCWRSQRVKIERPRVRSLARCSCSTRWGAP